MTTFFAYILPKFAEMFRTKTNEDERRRTKTNEVQELLRIQQYAESDTATIDIIRTVNTHKHTRENLYRRNAVDVDVDDILTPSPTPNHVTF